VRNCYEALVETKDKSNMKLNWYRDFTKVLDLYECADLIKDGSETNDIFTISLLRCNVLRKLDSVQDKLIQSYIVRMQKRVKMLFCKNIRTQCKIDERMVISMNWNHVILLAQLKSDLPRISHKDKRVSFNAMNIYFGQPSANNNDKCSLCPLLLPETLFHVLIECPSYVLIRQN
jgi:hypothetical protein